MFSLFITMSYYWFAKSSDIRQYQRFDDKQPLLVPPNPDVDLPPSSSRLHIFRQAAVSSDSDVCSGIAM